VLLSLPSFASPLRKMLLPLLPVARNLMLLQKDKDLKRKSTTKTLPPLKLRMQFLQPKKLNKLLNLKVKLLKLKLLREKLNKP
jgi:predicted nuclease of predicted toxin-antitoxin system